MEIPSSADPVWRDIITGKVHIRFELVAVKILHGALSRSFARDPSPRRLEKCARDLREFFVQNAQQPAAQKDLEKIGG
jgi:hypothetical protein